MENVLIYGISELKKKIEFANEFKPELKKNITFVNKFRTP